MYIRLIERDLNTFRELRIRNIYDQFSHRQNIRAHLPLLTKELSHIIHIL